MLLIKISINLIAGQYGKGVFINLSTLTEEELLRYNDGYEKNGFNQFVSDMIPLSRYVGDVRHPRYRYIPLS